MEAPDLMTTAALAGNLRVAAVNKLCVRGGCGVPRYVVHAMLGVQAGILIAVGKLMGRCVRFPVLEEVLPMQRVFAPQPNFEDR